MELIRNNLDTIYEQLINRQSNVIKMYYHTKWDMIVGRDKLPANAKYFIELPYVESCKCIVWRYFYAMLNDEQYALVNSFTERSGFFDYMQETGLIAIYYAALDKAIAQRFKEWEKKYGLNIDWFNIDVD